MLVKLWYYTEACPCYTLWHYRYKTQNSQITLHNKLFVKSWSGENDTIEKSDDVKPFSASYLGLPGAGGRLTRQSAARQLPTPLAGNKDSLASIGHKVWNTYAPLREAKTLSEAKKAAKTFSMSVPAEMHKS